MLLDQFISYALHFLCQVFIKLIPIWKISQAVRALKWYRPCIHFSKVSKVHWNNGWKVSLPHGRGEDQRIINKFYKTGFSIKLSLICYSSPSRLWLWVMLVMLLLDEHSFIKHSITMAHDFTKLKLHTQKKITFQQVGHSPKVIAGSFWMKHIW